MWNGESQTDPEFPVVYPWLIVTNHPFFSYPCGSYPLSASLHSPYSLVLSDPLEIIKNGETAAIWRLLHHAVGWKCEKWGVHSGAKVVGLRLTRTLGSHFLIKCVPWTKNFSKVTFRTKSAVIAFSFHRKKWICDLKILESENRIYSQSGALLDPLFFKFIFKIFSNIIKYPSGFFNIIELVAFLFICSFSSESLSSRKNNFALSHSSSATP